MRSLFEVASGSNLERQGDQIQYGPAKTGPSSDLFGNAAGGEKQIASRLIVRDCNLLNHEELLRKTEIPYTEGKTEVVIDRITSAASPRQIERVPAGATFRLNMVINIWETENKDDTLMNNFFESLTLLQDDYLGGGGSRGNGQIAIKIDDIQEKSITGYYEKAEGKPISILTRYSKQLAKLHA
jgi:CRISPR-associated protein Csm3